MARTRAPVELEAAVEWRQGVHMRGASLWCDAPRARDVCFVSAADAVKPSRHGQVIATAETLALLARSSRHQRASSELAVPLGRPFTLGTTRLELFDNGHGIGAAGLSVTTAERRIVYAGTVCPRGSGCDARAADVLIARAPYGAAVGRLADPGDAAASLLDLARDATATGAAAVLVTSALRGVGVAALLSEAGLAVIAARPIHHAARKLDRAGLSAPAIRRAGQRLRPGHVAVWLWTQRNALPELPPNTRTVLVSGLAALGETQTDVALPWSSGADRDDVARYIEATGAREVWLTGPAGAELAAALDRPARRVRALGPPEQLSLL